MHLVAEKSIYVLSWLAAKKNSVTSFYGLGLYWIPFLSTSRHCNTSSLKLQCKQKRIRSRTSQKVNAENQEGNFLVILEMNWTEECTSSLATSRMLNYTRCTCSTRFDECSHSIVKHLLNLITAPHYTRRGIRLVGPYFTHSHLKLDFMSTQCCII